RSAWPTTTTTSDAPSGSGKPPSSGGFLFSGLQLLRHLAHEQIALAADGLDQPRRHRVVAQLGADARDAHIDGTVLAVVLDAAQLGEDLLARQRAPGVQGQQPEQLELGAGQV